MKRSEVISPLPVAEAIEKLRTQLVIYYGCDFAFSIMGRGCLLSASSMKDGDIRPCTEKQLTDKS